MKVKKACKFCQEGIWSGLGWFRILEIQFNRNFFMHECADEAGISSNCKLRILMRTHRYYTSYQLIVLYKADILKYLECRTPALLHAADSVTTPIDMALTRF